MLRWMMLTLQWMMLTMHLQGPGSVRQKFWCVNHLQWFTGCCRKTSQMPLQIVVIRRFTGTARRDCKQVFHLKSGI